MNVVLAQAKSVTLALRQSPGNTPNPEGVIRQPSPYRTMLRAEIATRLRWYEPRARVTHWGFSSTHTSPMGDKVGFTALTIY